MSREVNIVSLRHLSARLRTRRAILRDVATTADSFYRPYHNRKGRLIDRPVAQLKFIQSRIQEQLLVAVPLPESLHGGVRGKSPRTNASSHVDSRTVVRIDVRQFYPHVTNGHVFAAWRHLGCSVGVSRMLTQLTTRRGHLPLGAPTSTTLANLVLGDVDAAVRKRAAQQGISFTRYVDDIVIGGERPELLIPLVVEALAGRNFKVARRKTSIMRSHRRQVVTGLVVNGTKEPRIPKPWRLKLRAEIYHLSFCDESQRRVAEQRIRSKIAYLRTTSPRHADRLQEHLTSTRSSGASRRAKPSKHARKAS